MALDPNVQDFLCFFLQQSEENNSVRESYQPKHWNYVTRRAWSIRKVTR
jgi:hypothetical protein